MEDTKVCNCCKLPKVLDDFGNNAKRPDGKQPYCRDCGKSRDKKHYNEGTHRKSKVRQAKEEAKARNRQVLLEFLRKHPCVDCGEESPIFLDFDHVRGEKRLEVTTAANHGWCLTTLQEEMNKCDIRCVKCHRVKTAKEQGWYHLYVEGEHG